MGVTTSQLQKMLEKGEVMATDLIPRLADELENNFGKAAENAGDRADASFKRFANAVEELRRSLANSGILDFLSEMAARAAAVVNTISFLLKPGRMGDFADIAARETRIRKLKELEKIENENIAESNKKRQEMLDAVPDWVKSTGIFKTEQNLNTTNVS